MEDDHLMVGKNPHIFHYLQAEKTIADDEEEKVGIIAEEVGRKQKGFFHFFLLYLIFF